jgi:hypothetical protein
VHQIGEGLQETDEELLLDSSEVVLENFHAGLETTAAEDLLYLFLGESVVADVQSDRIGDQLKYKGEEFLINLFPLKA